MCFWSQKKYSGFVFKETEGIQDIEVTSKYLKKQSVLNLILKQLEL